MDIKYIIVQHDISKKRNEENLPTLGIKLINSDNTINEQECTMTKQLKPFSIALQKYGLSWSERYKEYVIPDEICLDKSKLNDFIKLIEKIISKYNNGEMIVTEDEWNREKTNSYYTKKYAIKYLQEYIEFNLDKAASPIILDPCAGMGNLIDGLSVNKDSIWAIDSDKKCCDILNKKGYSNVINTTFEEAVANNLIPKPTHIIMNPPFSKQQDISFYNLACELLEDNGALAAIISENSIYEELSKYNFLLDDSFPKNQAIEILQNQYFDELSKHMQEFLINISSSKIIFVDYVTSEVGFENTNARAFYFRQIVGKKEKKLRK